MRNWTLDVRDLPDPVPAAGQALVRTLACGICGSDLHMLKHGAAMQELGEELAKHAPPEPDAAGADGSRTRRRHGP